MVRVINDFRRLCSGPATREEERPYARTFSGHYVAGTVLSLELQAGTLLAALIASSREGCCSGTTGMHFVQGCIHGRLSTPEGCLPGRTGKHFSLSSKHTVGQAPDQVVGTKRRNNKFWIEQEEVFP
eukprot:10011616-Heterocapsa_arctica.AAC.1